jgi:hypothetical protein
MKLSNPENAQIRNLGPLPLSPSGIAMYVPFSTYLKTKSPRPTFPCTGGDRRGRIQRATPRLVTPRRGASYFESIHSAGNSAAIFGAFVFVELAVGGFDEFGGGAAVFGDRCRRSWAACPDRFAGRSRCGSDLLGHALVRVNHYESKLIAAVAHGEVGGTAVLVHDGGEALKGAISRQGAVKIVDAFQAVEVQQENGESVMAALGAVHFLYEAVHEFAVVG